MTRFALTNTDGLICCVDAQGCYTQMGRSVPFDANVNWKELPAILAVTGWTGYTHERYGNIAICGADDELPTDAEYWIDDPEGGQS